MPLDGSHYSVDDFRRLVLHLGSHDQHADYLLRQLADVLPDKYAYWGMKSGRFDLTQFDRLALGERVKLISRLLQQDGLRDAIAEAVELRATNERSANNDLTFQISHRLLEWIHDQAGSSAIDLSVREAGIWNATSLSGQGPLTQEAIVQLLKAAGIDRPDRLGPRTNVLIVGRSDWEQQRIQDVLSWRAGSKLKIYSQELFLALIHTGQDPFELEREQLISLAGQHAAIEWLLSLNTSFDWPSTKVWTSHEPLDKRVFTTREGVLEYFGYSVGRSRGLPDQHRQRILSEVFECDLLEIAEDSAYLREWDRPASSKRLWKLAKCLAAFCRLAQGQHARDYDVAIMHWEFDLQWLKERYYRPLGFVFDWPNASIS